MGDLLHEDRVATTYINQVGVRTGNTQFQEKLSYSYSCLERGLGIGAAIIGGAIAGSPLAVVEAEELPIDNCLFLCYTN